MTPATPERWLPIPGFEGLYEVSDLGRVRSVERTIVTSNGPRTYRGQLLRPYVDPNGRPRITLRNDHNFRICGLVLMAFVDPRPARMVACHNNGDSADNRLANLRWDTMSENNYDLVRHGRHIHARKTHCKRGHELVAPNLKASHRDRTCLACVRAKDALRWQPNAGADIQALSDSYYDQIMLTANKETPCSAA